MSELRSSLATLGDDELGAELRLLAGWLDTPASRTATGTPDPARRARLQIEAGEGRRRPSWWPYDRPMVRPVRRSMLLAAVALLVAVAIVGAIGFGVPGIRIIFTGGPSPSPAPGTSAALPSSSPTPTASPTAPGPPGSALDLGFRTTTTEVPTLAGFPLALPASASVGSPDTIWFREGRVSLVWAARPGLPETEAAGIGLLLTEFQGSVNEDFFQKMLGPDTTITPVIVGGETGWWISGEPHDFLYLDARGEMVFDSRRVVGDTLLWTRGDITFRMESSLGQAAAAIALAETIH